jgi:hypothetical protein
MRANTMEWALAATRKRSSENRELSFHALAKYG